MKKKTNAIGVSNYVKQLVAALSKADASFPIESDALTAQDKRHTVKVRKGSDAIIRQIAELVKAHGLDSTALHSEDMLRELENGVSLAPLAAILGKLAKRIEDTQYASNTNAWQMGLQFYALLQSRAQVDGQLAASLAPISSFFAYRHQAVLADKPTKLQTRMNAKLRTAERLVARSKPRADVLEEAASHPSATPAAAPVSTPAPEPAPKPVAQPAPAPVVVSVPAPVVQPVATPAISIISPANGVTNGTSNGYVNGASNGALNGASSTQ